MNELTSDLVSSWWPPIPKAILIASASSFDSYCYQGDLSTPILLLICGFVVDF